MSGFAYDNVNHRLFVRDRAVNAWQPDGRILVFDVHPDRMENGPDAIAVFGQPDFESRTGGGVGPRSIASLRGTVLDEKNQRLFLSDGDNNRILVWDVAPERLTETPKAMVVLGQTSFDTKSKGSGSRGLNAPDSIYYDDTRDRLFVSDTGNHRVVVFDARPDRLKNGMDAFAVLGQPDFDAAEPGIARDRLARPSHLAYESTYERLFVADRGNRRILLFDASPEKLLPGASALHVLGQPDFDARARRDENNMNKASPGQMILSESRQRLFVNEGSDANRTMVFDVHPERLRNNPDALAVLFQDEVGSSAPRVSKSRETSPRPFLDDQTGKLYVASGYPGGNRVVMFDVSGDKLRTGLPAYDVLGHYDDDGNPDFDARAAFGRINDRFIYPRAVALDPIDHRLFVNDQYNNRVLVFRLDDEDRILDRRASVVLGQPHARSGKLREPSARTMQIPLALAYDINRKRLFVGDGWNNRTSLTGHLVFSTLHTNSAVETVVRLLDMGMNPFNFADALLGILAQRLARTLCQQCKESYRPTREEYEALAQGYGEEAFAQLGITYDENFRLQRGAGCEQCSNTGYRGRLALHEFLVATDTIKSLIHAQATVMEMFQAALEQGMTTLLQDGIHKILEGWTDFKQVRAVALK